MTVRLPFTTIRSIHQGYSMPSLNYRTPDPCTTAVNLGPSRQPSNFLAQPYATFTNTTRSMPSLNYRTSDLRTHIKTNGKLWIWGPTSLMPLRSLLASRSTTTLLQLSLFIPFYNHRHLNLYENPRHWYYKVLFTTTNSNRHTYTHTDRNFFGKLGPLAHSPSLWFWFSWFGFFYRYPSVLILIFLNFVGWYYVIAVIFLNFSWFWFCSEKDSHKCTDIKPTWMINMEHINGLLGSSSHNINTLRVLLLKLFIPFRCPPPTVTHALPIILSDSMTLYFQVEHNSLWVI